MTENFQKIMMYYDGIGRLIKTVNEDGSEQIVIYGIPSDLKKPQSFAPSPWEVYNYDPNDDAGRTHQDTITSLFMNHWDTPSNTVVDALGRKTMFVERNGDSTIDGCITKYTYDIRGNLLEIVDTLRRQVSKG